MPNRGSRSFVAVDLSRIESNVRAIVRRLGEAALWVVVKGNGYGIGLECFAAAAANAGCYGFVCAEVDEGERLREAGLRHPIVCLIFPTDDALECAAELSLDLSIGSSLQLERLAAQSLKKPLRVLVEVDTGMGRGGFMPAEITDVVARVQRLSGVVLTGFWSHLACSDDPVRSARQRDAFVAACDGAGVSAPRYLIGTEGLALGPDFFLNGARIGLGCLGLVPRSTRTDLDLRLAIRWTTRLTAVFERPCGTTIGYGAQTHLQRASRLGLIPVGISDGYPRLQPGSGWSRRDARSHSGRCGYDVDGRRPYRCGSCPRGACGPPPRVRRPRCRRPASPLHAPGCPEQLFVRANRYRSSGACLVER